MDIAAILQELDAEIETLECIRTILEGLSDHPVKRTRRGTRNIPKQIPPAPSGVAVTEPKLIVLPPKVVRRRIRSARVALPEPRALAAPLSERPIFVARPVVPVTTPEGPSETTISHAALESAVRRNILGGFAAASGL
jgi:hypothetical protein